jgi:hypothetical protein
LRACKPQDKHVTRSCQQEEHARLDIFSAQVTAIPFDSKRAPRANEDPNAHDRQLAESEAARTINQRVAVHLEQCAQLQRDQFDMPEPIAQDFRRCIFLLRASSQIVGRRD